MLFATSGSLTSQRSASAALLRTVRLPSPAPPRLCLRCTPPCLRCTPQLKLAASRTVQFHPNQESMIKHLGYRLRIEPETIPDIDDYMARLRSRRRSPTHSF